MLGMRTRQAHGHVHVIRPAIERTGKDGFHELRFDGIHDVSDAVTLDNVDDILLTTGIDFFGGESIGYLGAVPFANPPNGVLCAGHIEVTQDNVLTEASGRSNLGNRVSHTAGTHDQNPHGRQNTGEGILDLLESRIRPPSRLRVMRRVIGLIGPALVAGVAYLDPGNVASNITAGAQFGYLLLWVVVLGNAIAWLVQYLSAKLGLSTGKSLPEIIGERIRNPWARRAFWLQAEIVAMATDLAEVLGGAIALNLLFGIPLLLGGLITGALSIALLALHRRAGVRVFERVIIVLLLVIAVGFGIGVAVSPPDPSAMVAGLVPRFEGWTSVFLAASILGATVMPHAVYAHSGLTRDRFGYVAPGEKRRNILVATRWDVTIALVVAGAVNIAILLVGAGLQGHPGSEDMFTVYSTISLALGSTVAIFFGVALLASGLASTTVGAYAGGEIMAGLLRIRIPMLWRRIISLIPAIVILALGVNPFWVLIVSQVVLSFGIPFALIPLVSFTRRESIMGSAVNARFTTVLAAISSGLVIALNVWLIVSAFVPSVT